MVPEIKVDTTRAFAWLSAMPKNVHDALLQKIDAQRLQLEALIKAKLSGLVLQVRTGALRRSIFSETIDGNDSIVGRAASSGDVKYARIQEYGGQTAPHDIVATKAQALAFVMGGKQVIVKKVHHPGSHIPEHSYMRSSLSDLAPQFAAGMKQAVIDAMERRP